MGQQHSRESQGTQHPRYLDSDDERKLLKSSGSDAPSDVPDFVFSSQVPASTDRHPPFTLADVPPFKYEAPSSPDLNANAPYLIESRAATVNPPNPASVASSLYDISAQPTSTNRKRRSKKQTGPIDANTSTDSVQMDGMADELDDGDNDIPQVEGDFDVSKAPASSDLLSAKERRRKEKRERKAQRKAAKQASLRSGTRDNSPPARQIDPSDIHESAIPATLNDSLIPDSNTHADVTINHIPGDSMDMILASSKKRKLDGSGSAKKSKKQKRHRASMHLASDGADTHPGREEEEEEEASQSEVTSENLPHQSTDVQTQSSQPSRNISDSFSNLAETLYKGRKSTTSLEVDQHDGSSVSSDARDDSSNHAAMNHEPQETSSSSQSSINDADLGMDSAGSPNISPVDEMDVDDGTEKADEDSNNNSSREDDSNSEAPLPSDLDNSTDNNMLANDVAENEVEVPSSFPYRLTRSSRADPSEEEHPQSSTGQKKKRVAKTPYYDRKVEDDNTNTVSEFASPSVIAASRRTNNQRGDEKDNAIAGPSSATSNRKQKKISDMLNTDDKETSDSEPSSSRIPHSARKAPQKSRGGGGEKKTGPFTDGEIHDISLAIERWREDHHLTQFNVNNLIQAHPKEVRSRDMWDNITATCPGRPRQKVINLCRRKFHNFVARGAWTAEQHEELAQLVSLHGEKHSMIGKIINRHPEDVRDRIRNYVRCGDSRRKNHWDESEELKLTGIVLEAIEVIEAMRKKNRKARGHGSRPAEDESPVEDQIDWTVVGERMGTRGRLQCITKWKRIRSRAGTGSQLRSGSVDGEDLPVEEIIHNARETALAMSHQSRYRIVRAIRSSDANADSRIPWAKLREEVLQEQWTRATLMVVWNRLKLSVPDWAIMTTPEVAHQLVKEYRDSHTLDFPPDDDIDLDGEYKAIESKVNRIIKSREAPKTPHLVGPDDADAVKSDDDNDAENDIEENSEATSDRDNDEEENENQGEHEDEGEADDDDDDDNDDDDDEMMEDAPLAERGSSVDLGLVANINGKSRNHDELEIEDSEPEVKSGQSSRARGSHADLESDEHDSSVEAPSISKFEPREVGQSSSSKPRGIPGSIPQKSRKLEEISIPSSSRRRTTVSSRRKQNYDEIEDVSSDTNASEVESIPAH